MATRTGFQTFLKICHSLCTLFARYRGSIVAVIDASTLSTPDKDKLKAAMTAIDAACATVDLVRVTWES